MKTNKKMLNDIKKTMIDALEVPQKQKIEGKDVTVCTGDYVCDDEILTKEYCEKIGFDAHFTVNGESDKPTYLVLIQEIK